MNRLIALLTALCVLCAPVANAAERVIYYHNNAQGSPIAATNADGEVIWQRAYDPYGAPLDPVAGDQRAYTGAPRDPATGLLDLGARSYSADAGRFLSIDPESFDPKRIHSFNRYAYANNNPYRYVDPDGEFAVLAGAAIWSAGAALTAYSTYDTYQREGATAAATDLTIGGVASVAGGAVGAGAVRAYKAYKTYKGAKRATRVAKSATEVALEGGKHAGQLKQFMKQTPEQLQKTIKTFDKQIAKHEEWIRDPVSKVGNFNELRPEHQKNLVRHWQQDIARHKELKSIAQDVLKGL